MVSSASVIDIVKVRFKSPEKALMSNIIENERSSIQTDIPDFHMYYLMLTS